MTHFENIKAMSVRELSFFLAGVQSDICEQLGEATSMPLVAYTDDEIQSAASEWQAILEQEVDE